MQEVHPEQIAPHQCCGSYPDRIPYNANKKICCKKDTDQKGYVYADDKAEFEKI